MPKRPTKRPIRKSRSPVKVPDQLRQIYLDGEATGWASLEAAEGEDDAPKVPSFDMVAYRGGLMRPQLTGISYYGRGVVLDLAGWQFQPGQSAVNWQHNRNDPVGHIESHEVGTQVKAKGKLSIPGESRTKIVEGAKAGYQWRVSVEGSPDLAKIEAVSEDETITVNGRKMRGPFLCMRAGTFTGIAFVTTAGDATARAVVSAGLTPLGTESDPMEFDDFLTACGVDKATATAAQIATLQAAYDAQHGQPTDDDDKKETKPGKVNAGGNSGPVNTPTTPTTPRVDAVEEENKRLAANRKRVQIITDLCAKAGEPEIELDGKKVLLSAHAIETGMEARDVELEIYRNSAPRGPAIHSHSAGDVVNVNAMVGAVLINAGIALDAKAFQDQAAHGLGIPAAMQANINAEARQKALEASHKYGSVSLQGLARDALMLEGKAVPRDINGLIEAASSSTTLHRVYQATIGAALLVGYREAPRTLEAWTGVDETDDFKEVQRFLEDQAESLGYLPPNGEADHATAGAKFETLSVDAYAKQFEFGYHDYRNNNLGILARQPMKMGQAAYRTEENLGYAVLLSNPTMKSTNRTLFNTTDGTDFASRPLDHDNASYLIAAMASQTEGDATLDLMAKWALVPPQLLDRGRQVYRSPLIGEDNGQGTINTVSQHGVMPLGSPRLGNGCTHPRTRQFHAGSQTTHYLVADGIEVAARVYLSGNSRAPMVRVTQLTQGRWGTHVDVMHPVGFGFLTTKGIFRARAGS